MPETSVNASTLIPSNRTHNETSNETMIASLNNCISDISLTGDKKKLDSDEFGEKNDDSSDPTNASVGTALSLSQSSPSHQQIVKYRYTMHKLLELRNSPYSKRRPDYIDHPSFIARGFWKRFCESPYDEQIQRTARNINLDKRRSGTGNNNPNDPRERLKKDVGNSDPRDRLKKENDIVLSPQRRSFNMGCQMPSAPSSSHLSSSITRITCERGDRDLSNRVRIGSGRILNRDVSWDYKPDKDVEPEFSFRPGGGLMGLRDRDRIEQPSNNSTREARDNFTNRDDKHERRSYSRDIDREKDIPHTNTTSRRNNRFNNHYSNYDRHRMSYDHRDEEPEWFSGGPTSQNDTIELRGFEDPKDDVEVKHKSHAENSSSNDDRIKNSPSPSNNQSYNDKTKSSSNNIRHDTNNNNSIQNNDTQRNVSSTDGNRKTSNDEEIDPNIDCSKKNSSYYNQDFNFEDFLKLDPITGLLPTDENQPRDTARSSRFSQWFRHDSPSDQVKLVFDSPQSSIQDELNNMVNDFLDSPNVSLNSNNNYIQQQQQPIQNPVGGYPLQPSHFNNEKTIKSDNDENKYFSPISPAAKSTHISLLDFFQRGMHHTNLGDDMSSNIGIDNNVATNANKIQSVEELEARILQTGLLGTTTNNMGQHRSITKTTQNQKQDMAAFKKLLLQISDKPVNNLLAEQIQQQQLNNSNNLSNSMGSGANLLQLLNKQGQHDEIKKIFPNVLNLNQGLMNVKTQQQIPPNIGQCAMQQFQPRHQNTNNTNNNSGQQMNSTDIFKKMLQIGQQTNQLDNRVNDILRRPEAQTLIEGLSCGEVSQQTLFQQISNPQTSSRYRETMCAVLNLVNTVTQQQTQIGSPNSLHHTKTGGQNMTQKHPMGQIPNQVVTPQNQQTTTNTMPSNSDILPQNSHLIFPTHVSAQSKQLRVSPLPNGIPQRIPSPRELQFHTQSIMQNALIRKKLEEQRENYRKRQEIQQQQLQQKPGNDCIPQIQNIQSTPGTANSSSSPTLGSHNMSVSTQLQQQNTNTTGTSPAKQHVSSPTPLAFTPTSVLRKMTAEKDDNNISSLANVIEQQQLNMLNGIPNVKGNNGKSNMQIQQQNQQRFGMNVIHLQQQQQQQQHIQQKQQTNLLQQQQPNTQFNNLRENQQLKWTQMQQQQSKPVGRPILKGGTPMQYATSIEYQQLQQQLKRNKLQQINMQNHNATQQSGTQNAITQQQQITSPLPQNSINSSQLQQLMHHRQQQQQHIQLQQRSLRTQYPYSQNNIIRAAGNVNQNSECIINYNRDGGLSPTSNQLARWFSPELLAKAQAGKLPSINIGQALSLEEFERSIQHSSTTVHN